MKKLGKVFALLTMVFAFGIIGTINVKAQTVNSKAEFLTAIQDETVSEVKLGADITLVDSDGKSSNYVMTIKSLNRTLDLNGHTLTNNKTLGSDYGLTVKYASDNKTLTIKDSGTNGKIISDKQIMINMENRRSEQIGNTPTLVETTGSKLIIQNGIFESSAPYQMFGISGNNQIATVINGGTFKIPTQRHVFDYMYDLTINNMTLKSSDDGYYYVSIVSNTYNKLLKDAVNLNTKEIWIDGVKQTYTPSDTTTKLGDLIVRGTSEHGIVIQDKTITQYDVTFDLNGGTMSGTNPVKVNEGGKVTQPADPTRTGYYFEGWYKESTFNNRFEFTTETISGNTSIYAKWLPKVVGIDLKTEGTEMNGANYRLKVKSLDVNFHTSATPVTVDSKVVSDLYVDDAYTTPLTTAPVAGTTYYLYVSLIAGTDTNPVVYWDDAMKTGSVGTATGATLEYRNISRSPGSGSAILFFEYNIPLPQEYKVTYDYNGASTTRPGYEMIGSAETLYRSDYESLVTNGDITPPTNKELDYIKIDGVKWTSATHNLSGPITIEFVWKDITVTPSTYPVKVTINTFDKNGALVTPQDIGGTATPNKTTVGKGDTISVTVNPNPLYEVESIYFGDGATSFKIGKETSATVPNDFVPSNSENALYIEIIFKEKVVPQHTVTFFNDEGGVISSTNVNSGDKVSRPSTDPTKAGYRFDDWYTDGLYNTKFDFDNPITIDTRIYAKFDKEYNVTITDGSPDKTVAIKGETITITANPAPSGKEFDKWVVEEGTITLANANNSSTTFAMPESNVKVKATYKDKATTYTILEGANQTYTIDSNKDVVIKANGDLSKLRKIKVDGTDIDATNYDVVSGSTILTLKASYLNTLSEGDHSVEFVYNDGSVKTNLKVVKNSSTGGNTGGNTNPSGNNTGGNSTNTTGGSTTNNNTSSPQTSDNIMINIITLLLSLIGMAGGITYINRKELFNR